MVLKESLEKEGNWLFRYRSWLPLIMLLVGVIVFIHHLHAHGDAFILRHWTIYTYICLAVSLAGLSIRAYAVGHTPKGTSGRNTDGQEAACLNTTGAYAMVRHPLYLGNFLAWTGIAMLTCDKGFIVCFALAYWLYYERIIYAEEAYLTTKFGNAYVAWASHTPAFIPDLTRYVRPSLTFSWRKVLKKEKNGVFATMLVFTAFDGMRALMTGGHCDAILLVLCSASAIAYAILKYIKKNTSLLNEEDR